MIAFPAAAAVVAFVFAFSLGRRYLVARRPYLALWAVALAMYAVASAALALGVLGTWSAAEFETYWLFGAVLNVPYLAAGEVYLLAKRPWVARLVLAAVVAASVAATVIVF
ncbi:MAG TPA: hypothetical protein VEO00_13830, partial [Actinomycetota bacterium]|nr:hypothetical protein [Actinomycetota bacterium]